MLKNFFAQLKQFIINTELDPCPIARDLRNYMRADLLADLKAGISVVLLTIPQGMAYAMLAGLPIYYGITCAAVASIVGPILAGSQYTMFGPTNATAFLIFTTVAAGPDVLVMMPILVFLVGILLVAGAYLRIADLIQYVSRSVVVGYITGAAVLIIINQLKYLFGVTLDPREGQTFVAVLIGLGRHLHAWDWQPLVIGVLTIVAYFTAGPWTKRMTFPVVLVGITLLTALLTRFTSFSVVDFQEQRYAISDLIPHLPNFTDPMIIDRISYLFGTALGVAFLASLETSVMAKTLTSRTGSQSNPNQDMLGLGVANLSCAVLSGMPASGSLTRSALNYASGAHTRLSGVICGALCIVGALALSDLVAYIPQACLAGLIICVAITLINRHSLRICLNATRSDAAVLVTTITAALLSRLDTAIFLGTAVSIALYLKKASKPLLAEYEFNPDGQLTQTADKSKRQFPAISIVHVEGELFFGAAELFRTQIQLVCADPAIKVIILRLKNARHLDATSVMALQDLILFLRSHGRHLIISGASPDVYHVLKNSGVLEVLDDEPEPFRTEKTNRNLFLNNPQNPNLSTRDALIRAQQLIGEKEIDVRIFHDPNKDKAKAP